MTNDIGEWLRCADGREHYFVSGAVLCGTRSRVLKPQPPKPKGNSSCTSVRLRCAECVKKHLGRWLTAYQPKETGK